VTTYRARLRLKAHELRQVAGYRAHTHARATGTHVILVDGWEQGLESPGNGGPRWFLICDEHSGCVGFDTIVEARSFIAHPEDWCPTCQGYDDPNEDL
jgi:hypothetical protein